MSKMPRFVRSTFVIIALSIFALAGTAFTVAGVNAAGGPSAALDSVREFLGIRNSKGQIVSLEVPKPTPDIMAPLATAVPMAAQSGLSYTENFADIANWSDGFASGAGATRWGGLAVNASGTVRMVQGFRIRL